MSGESLEVMDPPVYAHLRNLSSRILGSPAGNRPLHTTELVHEAWIKLARQNGTFKNRKHFVAVAAQAMRQLIVDHIRAKKTAKRGGDAVQVTLANLAEAPRAVDLVALDGAIRKLEILDARAAEVVVLRVFGGLTVPETAEALEVSPRTVNDAWRFARAFLQKQLNEAV
jgi:RNA polymerase sigma factor (TIGR02999 family)